VSDTDESAWQHVTQKPPNEVARIEGHYTASVASAAIAVTEGDLAVLESYETLVTDGDAVGVSAEIPQHLLGAGHRRLAVHDPLLGRSLSEQPLAQRCTDAGGAGANGVLETLEELAAEDSRQDPHWDQKTGTTGDPVLACSIQTTARHDAVDVWMESESLRPGVQHGDRAGCRSQSALTNGVERAQGASEEQRVSLAAIHQEEGMERVGHGEDDVKVLHREQAPALRLHPTCLLQALALWAMAITTGVVERLLTAAPIAHLEMAPKRRCATPHDVSDYPAAIVTQLFQRRSVRLEDLRQFQRAARKGRQAYLPGPTRSASRGLRVCRR
jgi:hypothetical protein